MSCTDYKYPCFKMSDSEEESSDFWDTWPYTNGESYFSAKQDPVVHSDEDIPEPPPAYCGSRMFKLHPREENPQWLKSFRKQTGSTGGSNSEPAAENSESVNTPIPTADATSPAALPSVGDTPANTSTQSRYKDHLDHISSNPDLTYLELTYEEFVSQKPTVEEEFGHEEDFATVYNECMALPCSPKSRMKEWLLRSNRFEEVQRIKRRRTTEL